MPSQFLLYLLHVAGREGKTEPGEPEGITSEGKPANKQVTSTFIYLLQLITWFCLTARSARKCTLGILSTVLAVPTRCSKGLAEAPLVPAQTKGELKPSSHCDTACIGVLRRADISSSRQRKERRESAHDAIRGCVNALALPWLTMIQIHNPNLLSLWTPTSSLWNLRK